MSPEFPARSEQDPRLQPILEQYGDVVVLNHQNLPQRLSQAVDECPPFVNVLLSAESPEQLQQIVYALKASE